MEMREVVAMPKCTTAATLEAPSRQSQVRASYMRVGGHGSV